MLNRFPYRLCWALPIVVEGYVTGKKAEKRGLSKVYSIEKDVNEELGYLIKNH